MWTAVNMLYVEGCVSMPWVIYNSPTTTVLWNVLLPLIRLLDLSSHLSVFWHTAAICVAPLCCCYILIGLVNFCHHSSNHRIHCVHSLLTCLLLLSRDVTEDSSAIDSLVTGSTLQSWEWQLTRVSWKCHHELCSCLSPTLKDSFAHCAATPHLVKGRS